MNRSLNQLLHAHQPIIGTLLTVASPEVAEALALLGFDWVFIDLEHGSLSVQDAQRAIQAIARRSYTLVRVPDGTPENIKRVLDTGCDGIIVPLVNTESYARKIVSLAKYPPAGERSVGFGRAQGFGLGWRRQENPRKFLFHFRASATQLLEFIPAQGQSGELSSTEAFSALASMWVVRRETT